MKKSDPGADPRGRPSDGAERSVLVPWRGRQVAIGASNWPVETLGAFLEEVARYGNVTEACRVTGLDRPTMYDLRKRDPEFAKAWDEAARLGVRALEDEARRRAADGYLEPVFSQRTGERMTDFVYDENGEVVVDERGRPRTVPASVRKYSDALLIKLLQAHRPEKYRERYDVKTSPGDGLPPIDLTKLSDDELTDLRTLLAKAKRRPDDDAVDVSPSPPDPRT